MEGLARMINSEFWQRKTVLITGYEGFLGSWLSKILIEKGAIIIGLDKIQNRRYSILTDLRKNIICIKGNVANLTLVKKIIDKYKPSIIFHLAAESIVGKANKNPINAFKSNIEGTWNILEAARNKEFIEAVIVASSDKAYGSHKKLPYKEETPLQGKHPYDVSKSCSDLLCYAYYNTYNVPVCVTRCGNIYGPGDYHFTRIIPDAIRSAVKDKALIIRSDGKFTRDYIYIEDIVLGYIKLAEHMRKKKLYGEAFNFSNEKPLSVLELVKIIYTLMHKKPDYKILNYAKYEIKDQYLSSKKAKKYLKWKQNYTLYEGLKRTIDWYIDRYNCK